MLLLNIFTTMLDWYMANMNYFTIAVLMAVESTFIPLPSELVVPPAAWLAAEGQLNLFMVIFSASSGCLIGALINYTLSFYLGRKIIYALADSKVARLFFINKEKLEHAENYFRENGNTSTFIGRLVPAVRHLISIPAGLSKMDFRKFLIFTFAGSTLWNTVLALLGYFFGKNQEILMRHFHQISFVALGLGILFVIYLVFFKKKKK